VRDFMQFAGIGRLDELRAVTRAHVIAWRAALAQRGLDGSAIRHRLASLFEYLCERNAVTHNPVKGVEQPRTQSGEGKTLALGDHQARKLLAAPLDDTIKSKRDRTILSTLWFHALRHEELCKLKGRDFRRTRSSVPHGGVPGKGGKKRLRCTQASMLSFMSTSMPLDMVRTSPVRCSGLCATTAPAGLSGPLRRTGPTSWCGPIRRSSASRSAHMRLNELPVNHSPHFAPVLHPTMETGVEALVVGALAWLGVS
jgi:hypothetical protein